MTSGLVTAAPSSAHLNPGFGTIDYLARPELQIEALKHAAQHLALLLESSQIPVLAEGAKVTDGQLNGRCPNWRRGSQAIVDEVLH